jgi:hypothetical protein
MRHDGDSADKESAQRQPGTELHRQIMVVMPRVVESSSAKSDDDDDDGNGNGNGNGNGDYADDDSADARASGAAGRRNYGPAHRAYTL